MSTEYSDMFVSFDPQAQSILQEAARRLQRDPQNTLNLALALLQFYADNKDNELYVKKNGQFFKVNLPQ